MNEYGVPQRRKRVIIVGNREGKEFQFPKVKGNASAIDIKNGAVSLKDAIGDIENVDIPNVNHIRKQEEGIKLLRIQGLKRRGYHEGLA